MALFSDLQMTQGDHDEVWLTHAGRQLMFSEVYAVSCLYFFCVIGDMMKQSDLQFNERRATSANSKLEQHMWAHVQYEYI